MTNIVKEPLICQCIGPRYSEAPGWASEQRASRLLSAANSVIDPGVVRNVLCLTQWESPTRRVILVLWLKFAKYLSKINIICTDTINFNFGLSSGPHSNMSKDSQRSSSSAIDVDLVFSVYAYATVNPAPPYGTSFWTSRWNDPVSEKKSIRCVNDCSQTQKAEIAFIFQIMTNKLQNDQTVRIIIYNLIQDLWWSQQRPGINMND